MKTLTFFAATICLILLTVGISKGQGNKKTVTGSIHWEGIMFCTDDYAEGNLQWIETIWDDKIQLRLKGDFTGESGKAYSWSALTNSSLKNLVERKAKNETIVTTSVVECEGVAIALIQYRYHLTINANDEISVEFERSSGIWICL